MLIIKNTRLIYKTNTSGYRCVHYNKAAKKWISSIHYNGKKYFFGYFNTKQDAALAYNNFVIEHKSDHPLNIIKYE